MDVTKDNFIDLVPEIKSKISDCDFVSFDLEFTGLFTEYQNGFLDNHEQLYSRCRNNISKFQIIQVGLSFFKMITEKEFDCHSYNFYIFPRRCQLLSKEGKERYFLCQTSSLEFLCQNGFNFNKLICDGISYLNLSQEKEVVEKLNQPNSESRIQIGNNDIDKSFIDETMKLIIDFYNDADRQEMELPPANSYRRRLIYETVNDSQYKDKLLLESNNTDKFKIMVKKISLEEKEETKRKKLLEFIGFTSIIKLIIESRKPLVGHNCKLDLLYLYQTFIGPLPESYSEFKSLFNSLFPAVYDTRFISSQGILANLISNNCLNNLYAAILEHPFIQTVTNLKNLVNEGERFHEAGYDSYITGCSFINLIRYLYAQEFTTITNVFSNEILSNVRNKIGIVGNYDIKYINLEKEDISLVRNHVFHIMHPKEWKTNDIYQLFTEYGGLYSVRFINDYSAFCILRQPENAGLVIESLVLRGNNSEFKLQLYADYVGNGNKRKLSNEYIESSKPKKIRKDLEVNSQQKQIDYNNSDVLNENSDSTSNDSSQLFEIPSWSVS
ncbi:hypothetical protein BLOT_003807 [Blomia tropicalis]|nr:hypothetical protein BLOT_003807 [Blomia tropicalis]